MLIAFLWPKPMMQLPPSLLELQRSVCRAVFNGEDASILPWIVDQTPSELQPTARLAIYRNNTFTNLRQALRTDYPVVERLVGAEFFAFAADTFIEKVPSTSGDINDYGADFANFLANFSPAAGLPYLADVAWLERAWTEVFLAAEAVSCDFSRLAQIPPDGFSTLSFTLHPATRLLASAYPVQRIWRVNQPDFSGDDNVEIDGREDRLLLRRRHDAVEIVSLTPGEYTWLNTLKNGSMLALATEAAFAAEPEFDLSTCLQRHVAEATLIDYSLEQKT
jgi:hypothetical protein